MDINEFFGDFQDRTPLWVQRNPKTKEEILACLREEKDLLLDEFERQDFQLGGTMTTQLSKPITDMYKCYDNAHFEIAQAKVHVYACTRNISTVSNYEMPERDGGHVVRKYPSSNVRIVEKKMFLWLKKLVLVDPSCGTFKVALGLQEQGLIKFKLMFTPSYDSTFVRQERGYTAGLEVIREEDQWCHYMGSNGHVSGGAFVSLCVDPNDVNFPFNNKTLVDNGINQRVLYSRRSQNGEYHHEVKFNDSPYMYSYEEVSEFFQVQTSVRWYMKSSFPLNQLCTKEGGNFYLGKYPSCPLTDGYYQDQTYVYDSSVQDNGYNRIVSARAHALTTGKKVWHYMSGDQTVYADGKKAIPSHFPQAMVSGRVIMFSHDIRLGAVALSGWARRFKGPRQKVFITGTNVSGGRVIRDNVIGYTRMAIIRGGVLKIRECELGKSVDDYVYVYRRRDDYLRMIQCRDRIGGWPAYTVPTATLEGVYASYVKSKMNFEDYGDYMNACSHYVLSAQLKISDFCPTLKIRDLWMDLTSNFDLLSSLSIDWCVRRRGQGYQVLPTRHVPFGEYGNLQNFLSVLKERKTIAVSRTQWNQIRYYLQESGVPIRFERSNLVAMSLDAQGGKVGKQYVHWVGHAMDHLIAPRADDRILIEECPL